MKFYKATDVTNFHLKMRCDGVNATTLALIDGQWVFDRSKSGEQIVGEERDTDSLNGIRRMPFSNKRDVTLTIVMDKFSVEIFEDGKVMSSTIYPPESAVGLELTIDAQTCEYERAEIITK